MLVLPRACSSLTACTLCTKLQMQLSFTYFLCAFEWRIFFNLREKNFLELPYFILRWQSVLQTLGNTHLQSWHKKQGYLQGLQKKCFVFSP